MTTETIDVIAGLKAVADPTRMRILRVLSCCPDQLDKELNGPTAGDVCCQITGADQINSTISHHLKELREAGLVRMERKGKNMICSLNRDALRALATELNALADSAPDECC